MAILLPLGAIGEGARVARMEPRACLVGMRDRAARFIRVLSAGMEDRVSCLLLSPLVLRVSSPPSPSVWQPQPQRRDGDGDKQDYYVNMGHAIRTLREELPQVFYKEPSFDIYRDDIVFKDPLNTFVGLNNYKLIFWALRFSGRLFFKTIWLDIVSIWQPVENVIMIRWIVHGVARVPWEGRGRFDGTSEYKLDKNGQIYEHRVDNIAVNKPPKFRVLAVEELIQSLGCPSTPRPTYFETSASNVLPCLSFLLRFPWLRYYLSLYIAFAWQFVDEG